MSNFTQTNIKKWALSLITVFILTLVFVNNSIAQTPNSLSNLSISNISNTSAQINWQYSDPMEAPNNPFNPAAIQQFSIYYRLPNATSWTWAGNTPFRVPTNSYIINNLAANTTYIATLTVSTSEGYEVPVIYPVNSTEFEAVTFTTGGISNQLPVSNAGVDKSITLPTNSTSLSGSGTDTDGTIASYAWSVVSGPNTPTFSSANTAATTVSNLLQGTYNLQLRVTDNLGATATDQVIINVNAAPAPVTCTNDAYESNNTSAAAKAISVGSNISANICPISDIDFFSFSNSTSAKNIRVTLSTLPTNYIVELYSPNGSLAGSKTTAGTANKVIVFNTSTVGSYRVRVLAGTGAVASNSNYTLRVETSKNSFAGARISAEEFTIDVETNNKLVIYPNPAQKVINISLPFDEDFPKIVLYNALGKAVKELSNQKTESKIDISDLISGLYFLRASNTLNKMYIQKVLVVE